jgi:hypothetical protein
MGVQPRHFLRRRAFVLSCAFTFWSASLAPAHDASPPRAVADRSGAASRVVRTVEAPYLAENAAAMRKMMHDMAVIPTGDVDRDFVAMMVPHHQGAIDMAIAVLRYGHNEQLKRLAQEIIVTQQQEIAAMRLGVGEPLPPSIPSPTEPSTAQSQGPRSQP